MGRFTGILGLLTMLGLAYAFSTNRRAIRLKTVAWGLGLQIVFAVFVLKVEIGRRLFAGAGNVVNHLLSYSFEGSRFVFGELGKQGSSMGFFLPSRCCRPLFHRHFAIIFTGVMQFIIKSRPVMTRHGREQRRIAQRHGQHLHGTDRNFHTIARFFRISQI
jgi:CNT family concentrative nucleoside transporter